MRTLSEQEKQTMRRAGTLLAAGLILAVALWCVRHLQARRSDYKALLLEAQDLRDEMDLYQEKVQVAQKLMDMYQLDPMKLTHATLVAQASAAIQKAASQAGVQVSALRESASRSAGKEAATIQFEGAGQISGVMALLYRLERAGSPLLIDAVQFTGDSHRPDGLKVSLTILVLDFDQWKKEAAPNA